MTNINVYSLASIVGH